MRPVHTIQIFIVTLALSIGLVACAGRPSDRPAAAPTSAAPANPVDTASAAPSPDVFELAELKPVGEACGGITCGPGLHCCNPTCSLCTPKGVECTQQTCN